jgi:putative NADH-flavin reductase
VTGDALDAKAVAAAVEGQDAVLSALGVNERKPNTILSDATRNLLAAMETHGVRRLLFVSSLGVGETKGQLGPIYNLILLPTLLKHVFADKETAEALVRESGLDWTLVRPGRLKNGWLTGKYRAGSDAAKGRLFPKIARADVADFMLNALERKLFIREAPSLTY